MTPIGRVLLGPGKLAEPPLEKVALRFLLREVERALI